MHYTFMLWIYADSIIWFNVIFVYCFFSYKYCMHLGKQIPESLKICVVLPEYWLYIICLYNTLRAVFNLLVLSAFCFRFMIVLLLDPLLVYQNKIKWFMWGYGIYVTEGVIVKALFCVVILISGHGFVCWINIIMLNFFVIKKN